MVANTGILRPGINKGDEITITTDKGEMLTGTFISVNSKGANLKVNGKVISRSLSAITDVTPVTTPDTPADLFTDGAEYTTAELAAAFDMSARALRVQLRSMGVGVGKGRTYRFSADEAREIQGKMTIEA